MSSHDPLDDFDPTQSNKFPKGQSGNRRGRPKGSKNMKSIVQKVAHEKHAFLDHGQEVSLSTAELLFRVIDIKAKAGDLGFQKLLDSAREKYSPMEANNQGHGVLLVPEHLTAENDPAPVEDMEEGFE